MRVIVNLVSPGAIKAAGWRAKPIPVNNRHEASLREALKKVRLIDGSSLYDLIAMDDRLKEDWVMHVNGEFLPEHSSLNRTIRDNVQIHIEDRG